MKELNDFEQTFLEGIPNIVGSAIRAKRCIKCNVIYFVNTNEEKYVCSVCVPGWK